MPAYNLRWYSSGTVLQSKERLGVPPSYFKGYISVILPNHLLQRLTNLNKGNPTASEVNHLTVQIKAGLDNGSHFRVKLPPRDLV